MLEENVPLFLSTDDPLKRLNKAMTLFRSAITSRYPPATIQEGKVDIGKALDVSLVVTKSSETESEKQDTSSRYGNDADADNVDIRPRHDEEPMAEVQLTAECNIFVTGQHHAEQPEIITEGRVDQYTKQCEVKSLMLDSSLDITWFESPRPPDHRLFIFVTFSKRQNTKDICMKDGPSCLKKWKSKFFLVDRRAIRDHLTWRHSYSYVYDDLLTNGYDRNDVEWLRIHLILLYEMKEEVVVRSGLSFVWSNKKYDGDAKIVEEPHCLSEPLLKRLPSHTTTPVAEGALIPLPTLDEVATDQLDPRLARKSKGHSQVRVRSASVTMDLLDAFAGSALSHDVEYEIPEDDFGTTTRVEEIDLTLFPLAPDPDVCRKALDRTITPAELRRTESLLPLEFLNHVNVVSA
nr:hypothetical protein [Tanacetum cinerariifolium]